MFWLTKLMGYAIIVCMARTKGSKTRKPGAYAGRADRLRKRCGADVFRKWGKLGGNPVLLRRSK